MVDPEIQKAEEEGKKKRGKKSERARELARTGTHFSKAGKQDSREREKKKDTPIIQRKLLGRRTLTIILFILSDRDVMGAIHKYYIVYIY